MRISDWSSDVCSSDLLRRPRATAKRPARPDAGGPHAAPRRPADGPEEPERPGAAGALGGARLDLGRGGLDRPPASGVDLADALPHHRPGGGGAGGQRALLAAGAWRHLQLRAQRLARELPARPAHRSEEHTYELQSLMRNSYAV